MNSQIPTIKCSQILSLSSQIEDADFLYLINFFQIQTKMKFSTINNNSKNPKTIKKKEIFLKMLNNYLEKVKGKKEKTEIEEAEETEETETEETEETEIEEIETDEEEENVIETVKNKILSSRQSQIEAVIEKKNALYKSEEYLKLSKKYENLKTQLIEIETEIQNKFKNPAREIEREIEKLKTVEPEEMKEILFEMMCEADEKEERLKIKELLKQIETEISKPKPKIIKRGKDRTDATYPKCPNGCGAKRNKLEGFKSHLGYGENPAKNCRKMGAVIKSEEQLIQFWNGLNK